MQIVTNGDKVTICMKCLILFYEKNKKNITNISSAELAQRVVKVKSGVIYVTRMIYSLGIKLLYPSRYVVLVHVNECINYYRKQ